jgi:nucleotide-binding universal stress UspA family protein
MNATRPVIVTTDGSVHSHRVLPHAALLALALDTSLSLVSIVEADDVARAEADLKDTLWRLGIAGEVMAQAAVDKEDTAAAILRLARERDAAVLALDSRGHGALRHLLHGSVAHDLLRRADRPMMICGPNLEPAPGRVAPYRIVITNDGSKAAEAIVLALGPLLSPRRFEVTLLRIHEHEPAGQDEAAALEACERELQRVREMLSPELPVTKLVRSVPRGAGIDTAIIEEALRVNAQAIGMSTHGMTASRHVLMGGLATLMLGRSALPLILARAEV